VRASSPKLSEWVQGIRDGDRALLGRAITLVESTKPSDREKARALIAAVFPYTHNAHRIGITGVPGVGKSTFIDAFGSQLTNQGHQVAVLAIDPSSPRTGGSILGDKTRMGRLSVDPKAFVRPSPTSGALGGVGNRTREAVLLCEAAGYDIVIVETVGVGQSELSVRELTDVFLVLMLAGAGDELQGIKRGLMETADLLAVNKTDGDNIIRARQAAATYRSALQMFHSDPQGWRPEVLCCSSLNEDGLDTIWERIQAHKLHQEETGEWTRQRQQQGLRWMWGLIDSSLRETFRHSPAVSRTLEQLETEVLDQTVSPPDAADRLLSAFMSTRGQSDRT
jgi:LAO/AO transport system kinase